MNQLFKVVSLCGETEELAVSAEEAVLQHCQELKPYSRLTVIATLDGSDKYVFHVTPALAYHVVPAPHQEVSP